MRAKWATGVGLLLVVVGVALVVAGWPRPPAADPSPTATPAMPTPEPLVPTRTPLPVAMGTLVSHEAEATSSALDPSPSALPTRPPPSPTPRRVPTAVPQAVATPAASGPIPSATVVPTAPPVSGGLLYRGLPRWCVGVPRGPISRYNIQPLRLGWYLDWRARPDPPRPGGLEYAQMVRLRGGVLRPDRTAIAAIARANPGSLWLIGNEPDVKWQDNVEPAVYARLYHEAYTAIKAADPSAVVAAGGVAQPTPLRLRYLDAVLMAYREQFGVEMPADAWHVHNFILREERGSWGVEIPPGLPDHRGMLYEVDDCDNLEAFRRQIWDFRRWMAARGFRDRPLIVSEYGIPMPEDYGFPPERVIRFLRGTFEFFLTAFDPSLGDPADGHRLVQRWCWYSLDALDTDYPQGRLLDPQTGDWTAVGEGWRRMVASFIP